MYIARLRDLAGPRFELRRSIQAGAGLDFERIFDLGNNPGQWVTCERFACHYDMELLEALDRHHVDPDELDRIFEPFVPHGTARNEPRSSSWQRTRLTSSQEEILRALHSFDRRRLAYLRTGEINLSRIDEVNPKMFRSLLGKCRDELEQMFLGMERNLPRKEVRSYVYAIFNLQRHLTTLTARSMPEAQEEDLVDAAFMLEFCVLRENRAFWIGSDQPEIYARRYVYMHFDFDFEGGRGFEGVFEDFMNGFRKPQKRAHRVQPEKVQELFGMTMAEIKAMSRRDFARIFRKKAMSMHPDRGGDHNTFVELLTIYKNIVASKPEK